MVTASRNSAATTRGKPFPKGNPGRLPGTRNKASLAIEALLDGEAEGLTRKAVEVALTGDVAALRLCLDRISPPRRERAAPFTLPTVEGAQDHPAAIGAILAAVAAGELAPAEGEVVCRVLGEHRKAVEVADLERRIAALEGRA